MGIDSLSSSSFAFSTIGIAPNKIAFEGVPKDVPTSLEELPNPVHSSYFYKHSIEMKAVFKDKVLDQLIDALSLINTEIDQLENGSESVKGNPYSIGLEISDSCLGLADKKNNRMGLQTRIQEHVFSKFGRVIDNGALRLISNTL